MHVKTVNASRMTMRMPAEGSQVKHMSAVLENAEDFKGGVNAVEAATRVAVNTTKVNAVEAVMNPSLYEKWHSSRSECPSLCRKWVLHSKQCSPYAESGTSGW